MGLDIYLYKCDDRSVGEKAEAACEQETEPLWAAVPDNGTDPEEYAKAIANIEKIAAGHGCDTWGTYTGPGCEERVNEDAADSRYPDHICNLGYLRSSYNSGGYNSVAEQRGWPTFYDIFPHDGDDYIVTPNWAASLAVVDAALAKVSPEDSRYYTVELHGPLRADAVVDSPKEALELFRKERDKPHGEDFTCYSNAYGFFDLEGSKVVAAINAKPGFLSPSVYLVCEREQTEEDHYLQTLKITKALIEYVLAQPDKEKYYFHWSG